MVSPHSHATCRVATVASRDFRPTSFESTSHVTDTTESETWKVSISEKKTQKLSHNVACNLLNFLWPYSISIEILFPWYYHNHNNTSHSVDLTRYMILVLSKLNSRCGICVMFCT